MNIKNKSKKTKFVNEYNNLAVLATNVAVTPKVKKSYRTAIMLSVALSVMLLATPKTASATNISLNPGQKQTYKMSPISTLDGIDKTGNVSITDLNLPGTAMRRFFGEKTDMHEVYVLGRYGDTRFLWLHDGKTTVPTRNDLTAGGVVTMGDGSVMRLQGNNSDYINNLRIEDGDGRLEVTNDVTIKNINMGATNLSIGGTGNLIGVDTFSVRFIKGMHSKSSLWLNDNIEIKNMHLQNTTFTVADVGANAIFNITGTLLAGNSTLDASQIKSISINNLALETGGAFTILDGVVNVGTLKGGFLAHFQLINSELSVDDIKGLNLYYLTMHGDSSLKLAKDLKIVELNVSNNIELSGNGNLVANNSKGITVLVNGLTSMKINNTLNVTKIESSTSGETLDLKLSGSGTLNVKNGLVFDSYNQGNLDLSALKGTGNNANMLANTGINNSAGTLTIGDASVGVKSYNGSNGAVIESSWGGKLNVSETFNVNNGVFKINVDTNVKDSSTTLVAAKAINLSGNNVFAYEQDLGYEINHKVVDGNKLELTLVKTNVALPSFDDLVSGNNGGSIPGIPSGVSAPNKNAYYAMGMISAELQTAIEQNAGNEAFKADMALYIGDKANRAYNTAQFAVLSNTTKKEMNKVVANSFTSAVVAQSVNSKVDTTTSGVSTWASVGGSQSTIKGSTLNAITKGEQGVRVIQGVVGVQYQDTEADLSYHVGLAGGYGNISSETKDKSFGGGKRFKAKGNAYSGAIYGGFNLNGGFYNSTTLGYTFIKNDYTRNMDISVIDRTDNKSSVNDAVFSAINEAGFTVGEAIQFNPYASIGYSNYKLDGYEEKGNGLAAKVGSKSYNDVVGGIGARLLGSLGSEVHNFKPMVEVGYEMKLNKDNLNSTMSLANNISTNINLVDEKYDGNKLKAKAGVSYIYNESFEIGLSGQYDYNKAISTFGGNMKASYKF